MIEACITSTGNMYAKHELAIAFATRPRFMLKPSKIHPRFMLKNVLHDGTLIEEQERKQRENKEKRKISVDTNA